jgi:hypothetical protein
MRLLAIRLPGAHFLCSGISAYGRTSPAFTIHDAPEGTESLSFMMSDKDAPNFTAAAPFVTMAADACRRARLITSGHASPQATHGIEKLAIGKLLAIIGPNLGRASIYGVNGGAASWALKLLHELQSIDAEVA